MIRTQLAPRRDERGYVAVVFALLLSVLVLFASFAINSGGWFSRANQLQRAADAAALAGVVYMPDLAAATTAAKSMPRARSGGPTTPITVTSPRGGTAADTMAVMRRKRMISTICSRTSLVAGFAPGPPVAVPGRRSGCAVPTAAIR